MRAVPADFLFNCWYLEIPSDNRIRNIPRCVQYHVQGFQLETFHNVYVGSGSRTPELYSVSPDWLEYCFIYEKGFMKYAVEIVPGGMIYIQSSI
jgi:hypothetical protein